MSDNTQSNGNMQAIEKAKTKTLGDILGSRRDELQKLAGRILDPDRLIRLAVIAMNGSEYVQKCSAQSIIKAVLDCARMGLEPDGVHAALVPMNTKRGWECQAWPMYRGLVARAYDDETVSAIEARLVYEGERFDVRYGTDPKIDHTPDADCVASGNVIAAYAVIHMRGRAKFDVMWRSELDGIMKRSPAASRGFSPWSTDPGEMQKKTVLKRLTKTAPLKSQRVFAALATDEENDAGEIVDMEVTAELPPKPAPASRAAKMKAELRAEPPPEKGSPPAASAEPGAPSAPPVSTGAGPDRDAPAKITDEQKAAIRNLCDKGGAKTSADALRIVTATLELRDLESISDLTAGQARICIARLQGPAKPLIEDDADPALGDR